MICEHPLRNHALKKEIATFLAKFAPWHWFVTLTFDGEPSETAAFSAFRQWARTAASDVLRTHVWIASGYGPQERGITHFHALLSLVARTDTPLATLDTHWRADTAGAAAALADHWRVGSFDAKPVYCAHGAAEYLAKHQSWDLNVACDRQPRCRRKGCVIAPGPWSGQIN